MYRETTIDNNQFFEGKISIKSILCTSTAVLSSKISKIYLYGIRIEKCLIFSSLDLAYTLFIYSSLFIKLSNMPISTILTCNKILINLYLEFKYKTSNMHISTTLTCNKILINQYFINPMNICKKTRPTMLVSWIRASAKPHKPETRDIRTLKLYSLFSHFTEKQESFKHLTV